MVAAARLRRAQNSVEQSRPYAKTIEELLQNLASALPEDIHPFLQKRSVAKRGLVILSSDRGLCGAFNAGLFRVAEKELQEETSTVSIRIGRKAKSYFSNGSFIFHDTEDFWRSFSQEKAAEIFNELAKSFLEGALDQVDILYNEFVSVMTQRPRLETLFPFSPEKKTESTGEVETSFIFEPSREEIVKALVPRAAEMKFYVACLNSLASEFGARMTAMDSATRNAGEMIDDLTLTMNRVRQAGITKELVEIISGAEAIK